MIAHRTHRANRGAAWLAIFALLLQSIIPALHHPATMALGTPGEMVSLDGGKNLCLAPGSAPAKPADQEKGSHQHHMPACAICQAVHAIGGFGPTTNAAIVLAPGFPADRPVARIALLVPRQARILPQPRGPPAST
jgi:hypothetical protein